MLSGALIAAAGYALLGMVGVSSDANVAAMVPGLLLIPALALQARKE